MQKLASAVRKPFFKKFISLFSTDVLVRGANFLLIPVFLHLMSKHDFGVYGYLYNFAMTCSLVLNLGYHCALPKLYVSTQESRERLSSMLFTLTVSLVGFLAVLFSIFYLTDIDFAFFDMVNRGEDAEFDYSDYRPYLFVAIASMILSNLLTYYFIASKSIKNIQLFNIIRLILCNGTVIVLLYFSKDKDTAFLRLATTYVIELLLCCVFGVKLVKQFRFKYKPAYMAKALKIGLPICSSCLVNSVVNFGDKQFVMLYCGSEAMGAYNLATLIATIPLIVFQSFNFVWLPDFLAEKDLATLKRKGSRNAKVIFLALLALSLLIWAGVYLLLLLGIFPSNYFEVLSYLPMLLLAQVFAAMILYYFNYFTYFEKTHLTFVISVLSALVGYVLYLQGARRFGQVGVASAMAVVNLLIWLSYIVFSKRHIAKQIRRLSN